MTPKGTLYLIPSPLTEQISLDDIPTSTIKIIKSLKHFIVEGKKASAGFLKLAGAVTPFELEELNEHTQKKDLPLLLTKLESGTDVGLLSDAGVPCIADPGAELVKLAHEKEIKVVPLVGPSSILLSLMASGMSGQNFRFHGYLPKDDQSREKRLKELEFDAKKYKETQIFIETPYRTEKLIDSIVRACSKDLKVCIACNLREENELVITCKVSELLKKKEQVGRRRVVVLI